MGRYNKFGSLQLDMLKEAGNIGAAHAATSLSGLLNKKIEMKVPKAEVLSFNEIAELFGGPEKPVASVFLRIVGDVSGGVFFVVPIRDAEKLIRSMGDETFCLQNEIGLSAFQEAGNILAGSYLSSLSDFTGLNLQPTPPASGIDMAGSILQSGLTEISRFFDDVIMIEASLFEPDEIQGCFLFLPDPEAFETIFRALGVSSDG